MSHPKVDNQTVFAFEPTFLVDEEGKPLFAPIVKATYAIVDGNRLELAEEQEPVNLAGEPWGDPETCSYKYEPECAFVKPATDCVLIGNAYAPQPGATEVLVGFRVGALQKVVKVFGDRFWVKTLGAVSMSKPRPFERIPLIYERAFGGWDHGSSTPEKPAFDPRNPVGTGFRVRWNNGEDAVRLPNLEDPKQLIKSLGDRPPPAGFGFTSPNWQPRAGLAGTYDDTWMKTRMPLLPKDFDRHFFNAASPGLVASGYLKGDEPVAVVNASANPKLNFRLPGIPPPRCHVELRGGRQQTLTTALDTVIVNTDEDRVMLTWRAHLPVRDVPQDVVSIVVEAEGVTPPSSGS